MKRDGSVPRAVVTILLVASLLSVGAVGSATAHDTVVVEPGASGSCEDGDSGGSFETHTGDHVNSYTDPTEAESTVAALRYFADTRGECGGDDRSDYVEVHVNSAAIHAQYCYSERSDGDDGDAGNGDEPTDSATAGQGAGEVNVGSGDKNSPPEGEGFCDYNRDEEETGPCDPLQPSGKEGPNQCKKEDRFP